MDQDTKRDQRDFWSTAEPGTSVSQATTPLADATLSSSPEVLISAAANRCLTEDLALALLKRADLPAEALEALSKHPSTLKSRKVRLRVVAHPKTPRHISLPLLRPLFTFELMNLAVMPAVPADVKKSAEDTLILRLESISLGEKVSLARRASGAVAGALLGEKDPRIITASLNNSRLTEAHVIRALARSDSIPSLVDAVCHHEKWPLSREVQLALLRNQHTPMAKALTFAQAIPSEIVREVLHASHLPENIKQYLIDNLNHRT